MNLEKLLDGLRNIKSKYFWVQWTGNGLIEIRGVPRNQLGYTPNFCPITALARELLGKNYSPKNCYLAALELEVDFGLAFDLVLACNTYDRPEIRSKIEAILF